MPDLTNPAAVQQIKDARANKMGMLTPKPKTVVRVTAGPVAQGSGIRIVKGYVGGENDEGYGGNKHRHISPPSNGNIFRHLAEDHGWDEHDFNRVADAEPTERTGDFARTLQRHHVNEHPSQANGFHVRKPGPADCAHMGGTAPCEHEPSRPLSERRLAPRKRSDVPDELPDDIKNMKLDKSNVSADHDHCHYDTCADCDQTVHACTVNRGWNHQFARGQDHLHQAQPAFGNHSEGEWCQGCNDAVMSTDAPDKLKADVHTGDSVPDQLPSDIRDRKLDKSAADECSWCKEESADDAASKMAAAHKSVSPGEFAEKAVTEGTHSGLISPKGDIYAEKGYAHHGAICNKAGIKHAYGALVRKHGWARLTGGEHRSEHVGIEIKHNLNSRTREAVSDVAMYTEGRGGQVQWDCNHPDGSFHSGTDHNSLAHHLSRLQNSFAKGWLAKTPLCVCGHDKPKHVLWNGDKSGKTGACHGCFTLDWEHRKHRNVTSYHHFNADPHAIPAPTSNAEAAAKPARSARMTRLRPQLERLARDPGATPGEAAAARRMLEKGKGLWLRMQAQGFEGRPVSLKRTKRGLAFKKSMRTVVVVKSMSDVRSIKRFTANHVKPEHWEAADNWLHGAKQTIDERTGGTPIHHEGVQIGHAATSEHVAQGLAAMSPRMGWGTGAFAFDKVHGREMVGNKNNRGIGLGNSVRRARTAIRGGGMGSGQSGKKTRALADLTTGGPSLPIDVHADRVVHYGRKPDHRAGFVAGRRHDEHAAAFHTAATDLGHEPRRHFVATWLAARDWKEKKGNTGIRAARSNEDSAGQPNVLRYAKLWPGQKGDPRLLMNSKTIWSKLPEGLRGEVKLGRMPRGDFSRVSSNARYLPASKRLDVGPLTLRTRVAGMPGTIKRTRSEKDWSVAHEAGHHMHLTRHQEMGAGDWNALPDHEKAYLTSRFTGSMVTHYKPNDMGPEGLAEGYAHLFMNQGGRLKANAPQAHAMLTAKLDNAKKYWKSQAIYGAHASLEKGAGRSLLPAESDTIITMTAKPQEGGV